MTAMLAGHHDDLDLATWLRLAGGLCAAVSLISARWCAYQLRARRREVVE